MDKHRFHLLAWVLAVVTCLSVCVSVTWHYCTEVAAWIKLILLRTGFRRPVLRSI